MLPLWSPLSPDQGPLRALGPLPNWENGKVAVGSGEARREQASLDRHRLRPSFGAAFEHPTDERDAVGLGFGRAGTGQLHATGPPLLDQAQQRVDLAHLGPGQRVVEQHGRVGTDGGSVGRRHVLQPLEIAQRIDLGALGQVGRVGRAPAGRLTGMDLDQLAPQVQLDEVLVSPGVEVAADQVARHRVERLGHLDVVVASHLGRGVVRQVIGSERCGCQDGSLEHGEVLGRPTRRGPVHPQSRRRRAPHHGPPLGVDPVDEVLTGEQRAPHVGHRALDPGLVLWMAHPRGVDQKAAVLRVLDKGGVKAWLGRVGLVDDGGHVVGDHHGEDPTEELPRRLEAADDVGQRLGEGEPYEAISRHTRREDERVEDAPPIGVGVVHEPHAAEVDLELDAGFAVDDADGLLLATTGPAQLGAEALHGALGDAHPLAGQQGVDLDHRETLVVEPGADLLLVALEGAPRLAMTAAAMRPDPLNHRGQDLVGQLAFPAAGVDAELDGRLHVTTDGLAIDPGQTLDRPQPFAPEPEPEHLLHLEHGYLPESHRRSSDRISVGGEWTGSATGAGGPPGWSHYWRKGGPMLVAELSSRWSHARGGRQQ